MPTAAKSLSAWKLTPTAQLCPSSCSSSPRSAGFRIREIFIPYGERIGETTLQRFSSTVWTFRRILRLAFSRMPVLANEKLETQKLRNTLLKMLT